MSNENEKYQIIKEQVTRDVIAKIAMYSVEKDGYLIVPIDLLNTIKAEAKYDKCNC